MWNKCVLCTYFLGNLRSTGLNAETWTSHIDTRPFGAWGIRPSPFPDSESGFVLRLIANDLLSEDGNAHAPGLVSSFDFEMFQPFAHDTSHPYAYRIEKIEADVFYDVPLRPSCTSSVSLVLHWLNTCKDRHKDCLSSAPRRLPTRVVDVGPADGREEPKVVVTEREEGLYLTLSYRWSDHAVKTTRMNLEAHQRGISMDTLPPTIREAVVFTRLLGYRYLWVDALCIMQDDDDDWHREAAALCSVYENATLSLSAIASDGNGLFTPRTNNQIIVIDSGGSPMGIRPPMRRSVQELSGMVLNTRGWTLQERILAPVILHFGPDQLYWECASGFASESFPSLRSHEISAKLRYSDDHTHLLKRGHDIYSNVKMFWHILIESYTRRQLTRKSDCLPAVAGLMKKFQLRDPEVRTYHYGLWEEYLHIGLMWSVTSETPMHLTRSRDPTMPSWSWASFEIPVHYAIGYSRRSSGLEYRAKSGHSLTAVLGQPKLQGTGICRPGRCQKIDRDSRRCTFLLDTVALDSDSFLCDLDYMDEDMGEGQIIPQTYYCLLIAEDETVEEWGRDYYIILERVDNAEYPDEHRVYRRAGVGRYRFAHSVAGDIASDIVIV